MKNDQPSENPSKILIFAVRFIFLCVSKIVWRISFIGKKNIPKEFPESGLLIVSNHQTYLDPFWISIPVKRDFRYMAWDKAFEWFFVGWLIRNLGSFPVNTNFGSRKSYVQAVKFLRQGKTLMVFPEAAREFADGKLLPFKTGAAKLALQADVPILPVTIRGANRVWAREMKFPRFAKIEIVFHPILETNNFEGENAEEELTEKLKKIIESKT